MKTINISEIESTRRYVGGVGSVHNQLEAGFFTKLSSDLVSARAQMSAYDPNSGIKRVAYIIVNFDDSLHEYSDRYRLQIEQFMKTNNPTPELEVVFDIKPPFYSVMS